MTGEIAGRADFTQIRYAQCWEDADVLLDGLDIQPGDTCLSISSAGDNALAMLTRRPGRVVALDMNAAQLACLELRVAAYRRLAHAELLELMGSRPSPRRPALYTRCRADLTADAASFWDAHPDAIEAGIGSAGKFERYFALFRTRVLPFVHSRRRTERLLRGGDRDTRHAFYASTWNTWRWRLMFRVFFSRFVLGRLGRDPSFFEYVEGSVADPIRDRVEHALTELDPADNPYLQWILAGEHRTALPLALRPEHFDAIRDGLDRVEWHQCSLEEYLDGEGAAHPIDRFNLSDIFEYVSAEHTERLFERMLAVASPGARFAYWNMLAPRSCPPRLADRVRSLTDLADTLHAADKAFFYHAFVVEEVIA